MPKTKADYEPAQWERILENLRKAREAKKAAAAPKPVPEPAAAPAPAPEPEPEAPPAPVLVAAPEPVVTKKRAPRTRKAVAAEPPVPEPNLAGVSLDEYFAAKYRAKAQYMGKPAPPAAPAPTGPQLIRQSATETIRARANDELMRMAMRSVFPYD